MEDWRRIDIDAYETDKFLSRDELVPAIGSTVTAAEVPQLVAECKSKLTKGQFVESLRLGLANPPYATDEATKSAYDQLIFEVLCSIKNNNSDIAGFIKQLEPEEQDTLVKYLYKIMGTSYGSKQGGLLLAWFEKTIEITGMRPIIRYMSDRRTV